MVTKAINNTLVETINSRESKMREMFPKLTKEKQIAVASRLSNLSSLQGEKIFLALFHEHVSELGQINDSLSKISPPKPPALKLAASPAMYNPTGPSLGCVEHREKGIRNRS